MARVRYQIELFWLALSFFSRIPIPSNTPYSNERMNQANRYFALVGLILGLLCGVCYWVFSLWLPTSVAVLLTMVFSLLLTGAFHEDGLTDMADGIGGGMTLERRLAIMKDSRIGTYGASALVMVLLGKFVLLNELAIQHNLGLVMVVAYTVSRAVAATFIFDMPYVTEHDQSKSKPLASQQSSRELMLLLMTGVLTALLLGWVITAWLALILTMFRLLFKRWLMARIGGFTGDCLGAAQQLSEMLIYLTILALSHSTLSAS